jgi:hypothetical protein
MLCCGTTCRQTLCQISDVYLYVCCYVVAPPADRHYVRSQMSTCMCAVILWPHLQTDTISDVYLYVCYVVAPPADRHYVRSPMSTCMCVVMLWPHLQTDTMSDLRCLLVCVLCCGPTCRQTLCQISDVYLPSLVTAVLLYNCYIHKK